MNSRYLLVLGAGLPLLLMGCVAEGPGYYAGDYSGPAYYEPYPAVYYHGGHQYHHDTHHAVSHTHGGAVHHTAAARPSGGTHPSGGHHH